MNKVKKFEISVVDRTYSKIVSNLVKFYSSDSALEVIFILAEKGYEFDSAELVLSNTDGSLITRPLTKVPEGYSYEFEKNIISHHGEWKGQVILTSGNDTYVSSKIAITIEDDLLGERPPKLTDVYSWTSLKRYADDLVEELKQAVFSVEGIEGIFNENETERQNQFETAEQSRQTTFEHAESERNQTFESNETTRQAQELEREKAETKRQSVFDGNEAIRTETFNANEVARQANEEARELAEDERENSESQRKIDHENRSAELAGKADKVVIENLMTLPDTERTITKAPEDAQVDDQLASYLTGNIKAGDKYYISADVKSEGNPGIAYFYSTGSSGTHYVRGFTTSEYKKISKIITGASKFALIRITNISGQPQATDLTYRNLYTLNLTETFGAGNEPSVGELEELLKLTGRINGEYALNNKEMLSSLMKGIGEKADKKQEDWITPTLLNGFKGVAGDTVPQYYMNSLGEVLIHGYVNRGQSDQAVFILPEGYRPKRHLYIPCTNGSAWSWVQILSTGEVRAKSSFLTMDGIIFKAGR